MRHKVGPTTRSQPASTPDVKWYPFGANASLPIASWDWKSMLVRVVPGLFPPELVVQVKALACELPAKYGRPLSRWSTSDLVQQVQQSGLVASISGSTLWRWLHEDAIRPGISAAGCFHAIRNLPPRRAACSIYTPASGKAAPCKRMSLSSPPTKRPAFKPAGASMPPRPAGRTLPCGSSMSTFGAALGPISLPSMYTTPKSLAAVKPKMALHLLIDSSNKS